MEAERRSAVVLDLGHDDVSAAGPFDACVVGAGPVGQSCARALCEQGLRVLLLESGTAVARGAVNDHYQVEVVGDERYGSVEWKTWRALGGTSWAWGIDMPGSGQGVRYAAVEPAVVERRVPGLPAWPLSAREVARLRRRTLELLGLGAADPALEPATTSMFTGLTEGSYVFDDGHRFARPPVAAGYLVLALDATVTELVPAEDGTGRVAAVVARSRGGRSARIRTRAVVLAANAVENARLALLLREQLPSLQDNTRLGKGLMDRPRVLGRLELTEDPSETFGRFALTGARGLSTMVRWCTPAAQVEAGETSCSLILAPSLPASAGRRRAERWAHRALFDLPRRVQVHATDIAGRRAGALADAAERRSYAWRSRRYRHILRSQFDLEWADWSDQDWRTCRQWTVTAAVEQLPDDANRVELADARDEHGQPLARVVWGRPASRGESARALGAASLAVEAAGLGRLSWPDAGFDAVSSHHLMGTLAFGDDLGTSAADPEGRIRGAENLFAVGACLFPTSGAANPTLTAMALSLHVADAAATQLLLGTAP